ncbi:MAG: transcription termination/antitermination NusG family protein [Hespellia sp.]|nr:transcription termination/antitermination NusG family protein [Hespellia sp.]
MSEQWYILFTQSERQSQLCGFLCREGLHAFVPMLEYYRRDCKALAEKPMFPGYIFIKSEKSQEQFDEFLFSNKDKTWGLIRQLKNEGTSALTDTEKMFFETILDEQGSARMSYGYLNPHKKAVITHGPLRAYENLISKVNKNDGYAYLNFQFMDKPVKVGLTLMQKQELKAKKLYDEDMDAAELHNSEEKKLVVQDEHTSEDVEIDLNDLISKMTQL